MLEKQFIIEKMKQRGFTDTKRESRQSSDYVDESVTKGQISYTCLFSIQY